MNGRLSILRIVVNMIEKPARVVDSLLRNMSFFY